MKYAGLFCLLCFLLVPATQAEADEMTSLATAYLSAGGAIYAGTQGSGWGVAAGAVGVIASLMNREIEIRERHASERSHMSHYGYSSGGYNRCGESTPLAFTRCAQYSQSYVPSHNCTTPTTMPYSCGVVPEMISLTQNTTYYINYGNRTITEVKTVSQATRYVAYEANGRGGGSYYYVSDY